MTERRHNFRHRTRWGLALRYSGFHVSVRAVGWALATWCDMGGLSREGPSHPELADAVGLDVSNVKRALRRLDDAGWIFRSGGRGRGVLTTYQLMIPAGAEAVLEAVLNRGADAPFSDPKRGRESQEKGAEEDRKGGAGAPGVIGLPGSLEEPADGASSGAPSPWAWSGRSLREWLDLSSENRERLIAAYLAADPKLEEGAPASELEEIAGAIGREVG